MKKIKTILICLIWTFNSFSQNDQKTSKLYSFKEIKFSHTNDKCGEWGGNNETIVVFRTEYKGPLFIEYRKRIMDCNKDPTIHYERKDYDERKMVKSTKEDIKLLELCIEELVEMKLSNQAILTHSGITNEIISRDSTFVIRDYPSKEWLNFKRLKNIVLKK